MSGSPNSGTNLWRDHLIVSPRSVNLNGFLVFLGETLCPFGLDSFVSCLMRGRPRPLLNMRHVAW